MRKLFTSESVTEGHPDKLADRISDSVLDAILTIDPLARVAAETILTTGLALIAGEISCHGYVDLQKIVRDTVREVGYTNAEYGIDADHAAVLIAINEQSPDIARGVTRALEAPSGDLYDQTGAGDQGLMFGYATNETPQLMPLPITLAHGLTKRLAEVRKTGVLPYLRPDGKAQVTVAYEGDAPAEVTTVVVSAQHDPEVAQETLREDVLREVVHQALPDAYLSANTRTFINPTGRFVIGGPQGDAGLTGRKIIVDTYGGAAPHGGRRVFRQGPDQGRPQRLVLRALHRQKPRRGGLGAAGAGGARLRHRRSASSGDVCRHLWHLRALGRTVKQARRQSFRRAPRRHHRRARLAAADIPRHKRLRSLWPRRVSLGSDQ